MSGTAIAAKGLNSAIRVFGAEPKGADDAYRSFEAGKLLPQEGPDTFCDGLLTSLGELTWPILRDNLEAVLLADDNEILEALRLIWSRMKIIIEPSCATPVAALRKHLRCY